jgi:hypothetical protein
MFATGLTVVASTHAVESRHVNACHCGRNGTGPVEAM